MNNIKVLLIHFNVREPLFPLQVFFLQSLLLFQFHFLLFSASAVMKFPGIEKSENEDRHVGNMMHFQKRTKSYTTA